MKFFLSAKRPMGRKFVVSAAVLLACGVAFAAQQSVPAPKSVAPPAESRNSSQTAQASSSPEFIKAADEVLAEMSKILDLPIKEPLKKSLRTKRRRFKTQHHYVRIKMSTKVNRTSDSINARPINSAS